MGRMFASSSSSTSEPPVNVRGPIDAILPELDTLSRSTLQLFDVAPREDALWDYIFRSLHFPDSQL